MGHRDTSGFDLPGAAVEVNVLFLGETITDVYHYGKVLGRPLKEPVLCFEHESTEVFNGGVWAVLSHACDFCFSIRGISHIEIRKERWIDSSHVRKLFEVYSKPVSRIKEDFTFDYDCVVVTDYGHGMFTPEFVERVCNNAKYLAVNVQTNAGNYGFNLATKWKFCDFLCVDESEARLATGNQNGDIRESLEKLQDISKKVVITLGSKGSLGTGEITVPAFTDKVVDTMGAGDAFFAVTSVLSKDKDMEELLRYGNAAGALKAQIIGHRKSVNKEDILEYLRTHP